MAELFTIFESVSPPDIIAPRCAIELLADSLGIIIEGLILII